MITAEREEELAAIIRDGPDREAMQARDELVTAHLDQVVLCSKSHARKGMELDDLISEGNFGLMRAVESFDPGRGVRFAHYASYWINDQMRRAITGKARPIRMTGHMTKIVGRWRRATEKIRQETGTSPAGHEIAESLGLSPQEARNAAHAALVRSARFLDDVIVAAREPDPEAAYRYAADIGRVVGLLDTLDDRESVVIRLRFGIGHAAMSLRKVGDTLGMSREKVRQIESIALERMARKFEAEDHQDER